MNDIVHSVTTSAPRPDGTRTATCTCGASRSSSYGPVLVAFRKDHYREVARSANREAMLGKLGLEDASL